MFDLGDQITIENNSIPWLIWIQIFVLFLLILLLYCLGICAICSSCSAGSAASDEPSTEILAVFGVTPLHEVGPAVDSCPPRSQVGGSQETGRELTVSINNRINGREEIAPREAKDIHLEPRHPCHFIELAKNAFLGCLGLGFSRHRYRDKKHEQ